MIDIPEINRLTQAATDHGATDLFLSEGDVPRVRIDHTVQPFGESPITRETMTRLWRALGCDPESTTEHDAGFINDGGSRFRANIYRQSGKLAAAIRPIPSSIPALDELGIPTEKLTEWVHRTSGLFIVAGPTAAGKSTTLAALLDFLNHTSQKHIITLEDPIEYLIPPAHSWISQREIGDDTPSFASGLRSALRQSPDVILVGEIRDPETAITALHASETGHLVLATLHAADTTDAIERLTNLFPDSERKFALSLLATELLGIFCQRLLPRIGGNLVPAYELLCNEGAVANWLAEMDLDAISQHIQQTGQSGNISLIHSLMRLYQNGAVEQSVAEAHCPRPSDLRRLIRGIES